MCAPERTTTSDCPYEILNLFRPITYLEIVP